MLPLLLLLLHVVCRNVLFQLWSACVFFVCVCVCVRLRRCCRLARQSVRHIVLPAHAGEMRERVRSEARTHTQ